MVFPVLPILLLVLGGVSLPFLSGCRQARQIRDDILHPSCTDVPIPDAYHDVDPASWRVMHALWLRDNAAVPNPWLDSWLGRRDANGTRSKSLLGAAEILSRPICEGKQFYPQAEEAIAQYRRGMDAFFHAYFLERYDPLDDGALVLLGGLAPADAGEKVVMGALNGFNDPTEKACPHREQLTEFTQLLKAAYYFNAAADRVDPSERFRVKRKHVYVPLKDRNWMLVNLEEMRMILDRIHPSELSNQQRQLYDVLKEAGKNLRAGF